MTAPLPLPVPGDAARPKPNLEGLAGEYYGWIARGELRFQRCSACGTWRHLPRPICAVCHSAAWSWERSSGRGHVYTWTVTHRSLHPAFTGVPYAQVLVEMDEGPRVLSWVVDVPPEELEFGMGVKVAFLDVEGTTLPVFERGDG